jgi:hypothetical protein
VEAIAELGEAIDRSPEHRREGYVEGGAAHQGILSILETPRILPAEIQAGRCTWVGTPLHRVPAKVPDKMRLAPSRRTYRYQMLAHFTIRPKRPAGSDHIDHRGRNSKAKRGRP